MPLLSGTCAINVRWTGAPLGDEKCAATPSKCGLCATDQGPLGGLAEEGPATTSAWSEGEGFIGGYRLVDVDGLKFGARAGSTVVRCPRHSVSLQLLEVLLPEPVDPSEFPKAITAGVDESYGGRRGVLALVVAQADRPVGWSDCLAWGFHSSAFHLVHFRYLGFARVLIGCGRAPGESHECYAYDHPQC